jgi:hypothetical protein
MQKKPGKYTTHVYNAGRKESTQCSLVIWSFNAEVCDLTSGCKKGKKFEIFRAILALLEAYNLSSF